MLNPRAEWDCYTSLERKFYADYGNPGRKKSILDDFANEAGVCTPPWCFFDFTCFRKMLTVSKVKGFRISFFLQIAVNRMGFWLKIQNFRKKVFLLSILGVFGKNQRFFKNIPLKQVCWPLKFGSNDPLNGFDARSISYHDKKPKITVKKQFFRFLLSFFGVFRQKSILTVFSQNSTFTKYFLKFRNWKVFVSLKVVLHYAKC